MKRKWVAGVVLALMLASVVFSTGAATPLNDRNAEPWPSFSMTYVERAPETADHRETVITYRFDYQGEKDWRVAIVGNTGRPAENGSWTAYKNDTMKRYDALLKRHEEYPGPSDGINVVDEWLIPRRAAMLQRMGWRKVDSGDPGVIKLVNRTKLPCVARFACINNARINDEYRTFDARTLIPLSVRDEMNGQLIHEVKVVDLVFPQ